MAQIFPTGKSSARRVPSSGMTKIAVDWDLSVAGPSDCWKRTGGRVFATNTASAGAVVGFTLPSRLIDRAQRSCWRRLRGEALCRSLSGYLPVERAGFAHATDTVLGLLSLGLSVLGSRWSVPALRWSAA